MVNLPSLSVTDSLVVYVTRNPGYCWRLFVFILILRLLPFDVISGGWLDPQNFSVCEPSELMI